MIADILSDAIARCNDCLEADPVTYAKHRDALDWLIASMAVMVMLMDPTTTIQLRSKVKAPSDAAH